MTGRQDDLAIRPTDATGPDAGRWDVAEAPSNSAPESPLKLVLDRLHGRWVRAIILAAILAPVFAIIGWYFGPVKYPAYGALAVDARLDSLVDRTTEQERMDDFESFIAEQVNKIRGPVTYREALNDERMQEVIAVDPGIGSKIASGLSVSKPRNTSLVLISFEHSDAAVAPAVVNSMIDAYLTLFSTDPKQEWQATYTTIQGLSRAATEDIESLKRRRLDTLKDSRYGIAEVDSLIRENALAIRDIDDQLDLVNDQLERIRLSIRAAAEVQAARESREVLPEELEPAPDSWVKPGIRDLAQIDPAITSEEARLRSIRIRAEQISNQFGPRHSEVRKMQVALDAAERELEERKRLALASWESEVGIERTWAALSGEKERLERTREEVKSRNDDLLEGQLQAESIDRQISEAEAELAKINNRLQALDRERGSISEGRIEVSQYATEAFAPSSDKKMEAAFAGALGGVGLSLGFFFVLGSIDHKTFGVRQLQNSSNSLRVLGVMPDMDSVESDSETVTLATDCVHRIRARVEARRAPERGYAMLVSSPFQGDGKTTLAVSLGWSYAESGYKTLLIDADFIGRAMSHQFGYLKSPGLREIVRNGKVDSEIHELGHPNLCLLPVGFDRRITAANLSPRLMSRVLESIRDDYDLIIIDTGPMTASIEAIPVATAADGVILTLRRGRSRLRLSECISDIRQVGTDYLGVVLNYADRSDCIRLGSTSRMSVSVQRALEAGDLEELPAGRNPVLGDMRLHEGD
ncbi:MAG: AAA family ATPase [Planctomycetota bacterium]|nr:AAA family ATPase [Planctomycetota bacterium]